MRLLIALVCLIIHGSVLGANLSKSATAIDGLLKGVDAASFPNLPALQAAKTGGALTPGTYATADGKLYVYNGAAITPASWTYQGAYSATAAYNVNDLVSSSGAYYLAVQANTGQALINTSYWQLLFSLPGNGANGSQIYNGSGAPGGSIGVSGDYYLDVASGNLYQKSASGWGSPLVSLKGGNGTPLVGTFASWSALQAASPASGNGGNFALVGSGSPYKLAWSDSSGWNTLGAASYSGFAALVNDYNANALGSGGEFRVKDSLLTYDGVYLKAKSSEEYFKNKLPIYWQARRAQKSGRTPCRVAIIGDSLSVGQFGGGGPNWYSGGSEQYALTRLLAQITGGTDSSFWGGAQLGMVSTPIANDLTNDTRISQGAGTTWLTNQLTIKTIGADFDAMYGANAPLTFTPSESWDTVDVYYIAETGYGSMAVTGSVSGTINSASFTTSGVNVVSYTKTLGAGSITFTPTNENHIVGVDFYATTSPKLNLLRMATGNSKTSDWVTTSGNWQSLDSLKAVMSKNPVQLWIINLGTNDQIGGVTAATFSTNLQTLITSLKYNAASNPNGGDVVLMAPPFVTDYGSANAASRKAYQNAIYALAASNGLHVVDGLSHYVDYTYANGQGWLSPSNTVHGTASGYQQVAWDLLFASGLFQ